MSKVRKTFGPIEYAHYNFESLGGWFLVINLRTKNNAHNLFTTGIMNKRLMLRLFVLTLLNVDLNKLYGVFRRIKSWHKKQKFDWYHRITRKPIYVYTWSRDCDMCESDNVMVCRSLVAFYTIVECFYDSAEGPCTIEVITKEQYEEYIKENCGTSGKIRDRVLEAFEDGRNHNV